MPVARGSAVRGIMVGVVAATLVMAVAACGPAPANAQPPASSSQALSAAARTPTFQSPSDVVWGRVPYCSCFLDSATTNVVAALKAANLSASLQELSPRDGWLYFAVTFEPHSAKRDQVDAALVVGGAEVLDGPP